MSTKFIKGEVVKHKKRNLTIEHFEDNQRYGRFWFVKEKLTAIRENELNKIN